MARLCVFPADPVAASISKGEIKERYFNPLGVFDEVHVVSGDIGPVEQRALRTLAGDARVSLHPLGPWRLLSRRSNPYFGPYAQRAAEVARAIAPDVVRAFTPIETGWLARLAGRAGAAPYVISVHGNYDLDIRSQLFRQRRWRGLVYFTLTRFAVERPVLRDAAFVICAYEFAARYVRAFRRSDVEVVYNRVSLAQFRPAPRDGPFTVLFVGRFEPNKGQELLIRAMREAPGELVLVGDGGTREPLEALARDIGVADRVRFIRSVPHSEMPALYSRVSCYASAIEYGGISIPQLEALASGLPIVVARPLYEREPEQLSDVALVSEREPAAMGAALRRISVDRALADELAGRSMRRARELDGSRMEEREAEIYRRVMSSRPRPGRSSRGALPSSA